MRGTCLPVDSGLTVTVPGAPALWEDVVLQWGRLPLQQVCKAKAPPLLGFEESPFEYLIVTVVL